MVLLKFFPQQAETVPGAIGTEFDLEASIAEELDQADLVPVWGGDEDDEAEGQVAEEEAEEKAAAAEVATAGNPKQRRMGSPFRRTMGSQVLPDPLRPPRPQNPDFLISCEGLRGLDTSHDVHRPSPINFAISKPRFPCPRSDSDTF